MAVLNFRDHLLLYMTIVTVGVIETEQKAVYQSLVRLLLPDARSVLQLNCINPQRNQVLVLKVSLLVRVIQYTPFSVYLTVPHLTCTSPGCTDYQRKWTETYPRRPSYRWEESCCKWAHSQTD